MRRVVADVGVDVDGILRENKLRLPADVEEILREFWEAGGALYCLTGAPLEHVPEPLFRYAKDIYAEMGGVRWNEGEVSVLDGAASVEKIRSLLGINIPDGLQKIKGGTVIVEGAKGKPRKASLTLLVGSPPHYPSCCADANFEEVMKMVEELVELHQLPLYLSAGQDTGYRWIDITVTTKAETVQRILKHSSSKVFYLGDGWSDLPAMKLRRIIPVGFSNCIEEIRIEAAARGVFIPKSAPTGGVVEFFSRLLRGEFSQLLKGEG